MQKIYQIILQFANKENVYKRDARGLRYAANRNPSVRVI